jgi:hypothetical protein
MRLTYHLISELKRNFNKIIKEIAFKNTWLGNENIFQILQTMHIYYKKGVFGFCFFCFVFEF